MRALRRAVSPAERRRAANRAATEALRLLGPSRTVAVYLSTGSELGTGPLIGELLRRHRRLCVPVVRGNSLRFVTVDAHSPLRRNRMGILEPVAGRRVTRIDAIIVPLLAFDDAGRRLGQGGGFYDRTLPHRRPYAHPLRIGYAYAAQEVARVPVTAHDVLLHAVVTERGSRWLIG